MNSKKIEVGTRQINTTVTKEMIDDLSKCFTSSDIESRLNKEMDEFIKDAKKRIIKKLDKLLDKNISIADILNTLRGVEFGAYTSYNLIKQHIIEKRPDKIYLIDLHELNLF